MLNVAWAPVVRQWWPIIWSLEIVKCIHIQNYHKGQICYSRPWRTLPQPQYLNIMNRQTLNYTCTQNYRLISD
uniref:Putative secreted protein n=1 Tax=Panstrongylus lignarius TaxID=156445 RepID=A0A224Y635_9HEMI